MVWDDFCSWYLESIKPDYQKLIDSITLEKPLTNGKFTEATSPFMPFLTEEIWHLLAERSEDIIVSEWLKSSSLKKKCFQILDYATEIVSAIRTIRKLKSKYRIKIL